MPTLAYRSPSMTMSISSKSIATSSRSATKLIGGLKLWTRAEARCRGVGEHAVARHLAPPLRLPRPPASFPRFAHAPPAPRTPQWAPPGRPRSRARRRVSAAPSPPSTRAAGTAPPATRGSRPASAAADAEGRRKGHGRVGGCWGSLCTALARVRFCRPWHRDRNATSSSEDTQFPSRSATARYSRSAAGARLPFKP